MFNQVQDEINERRKVEKQSIAWLVSKDPREASWQDTTNTIKWLSINLKGETEGLLVAAKDQAINTRNYQKVICGQQVESKCRLLFTTWRDSGSYCIWMWGISQNRVHLQAQWSRSVSPLASPLEHLQISWHRDYRQMARAQAMTLSLRFCSRDSPLRLPI